MNSQTILLEEGKDKTFLNRLLCSVQP